MVKMGIPKNRIIQERSPYVADNVLKKFNPETTAVVYAFGQKDAGRLKGVVNIFRDYKKSREDIRGYKEHGYFITAPQFGNMSGTKMRSLLGDPRIDDKERKNLLKRFLDTSTKVYIT